MSEVFHETTPEARLYPGVIEETVNESLGFRAIALISLDELEQGE